MSREVDLPDEIQTFLFAHIESPQQLEILVLLHEHREHLWSCDAVAGVLGATPDSVEQTLHTLRRRNLVEAHATARGVMFNYAGACNETLRRTARTYRERRSAVVQALGRNAFARFCMNVPRGLLGAPACWGKC